MLGVQVSPPRPRVFQAGEEQGGPTVHWEGSGGEAMRTRDDLSARDRKVDCFVDEGPPLKRDQ